MLLYLAVSAVGSGRLLSMLLDGLPTGGCIFGVIAELFLGGLAGFQLWRHS